MHSYGAGGNAFFTCQNGYTLEGDVDSAKCMRNGEWSVALLGGKNQVKYGEIQQLGPDHVQDKSIVDTKLFAEKFSTIYMLEFTCRMYMIWP